MFFNSFPFLFVFLPASLGLYWLADRAWTDYRLHTLALLSLVFYGYWDWRFVPLIGGSVCVNWGAAQLFLQTRRSGVITAAIVLNLLILSIFKYFNFFAEIAELVPGILISRSSLALPLGISFFTFHHIMYLTDLRRGFAPRLSFVKYTLYIAFFPQVLSGPLVRWTEIVHQFDVRPFLGTDVAERIGRALTLLLCGLIKKVLFADTLADIANPVFTKAMHGPVGFAEAWNAVLAFTFQIYFDFSGYTDMAIGIALMFGILLPQNFNVPYRAVTLQDFWRRWHMTLSRFLRDYLYIPLGGSRFGILVQVWALFATMLLGGLWHGASWTFVFWGALHGVGLAAGILWRRTGREIKSGLLSWLMTLGFVVLTWVFFRATDFSSAVSMLSGMIWLGLGGRLIDWNWAIAVAALVAMIGPTSWTVSRAIKPSKVTAVMAAVIIVLLVFRMGDVSTSQFIYFQF